MLGPGDAVPHATIWREPGADSSPLSAELAGDGFTLLCFYPFDWSPT